MAERKQIFGMDVIDDEAMAPGTFKLVNSMAPYDDVYVSYAGMTFVRKMTREDFKAAYPAVRQTKP